MAQIFRGVDHVGLTVPDMEEAHRFLVEGLGAEHLYDLLPPEMLPFKGPDLEKLVGVPQGTQINAVRMYKLGTGPAIEVFHYTTDGQRPALRACDVGFQHLAVYVDDMEAAIESLIAAGGKQMAEPWAMVGSESGEGNRFCFVMAPFGTLIELVTYPSEQAYRKGTGLSRWKPGA